MTLRTFGILFSGLASAVILSGCYVDDLKNRPDGVAGAPQYPVTHNDADIGDIGECHKTVAKGCFDGHIVSEANILVEGKQFFNADDLANRFSELLTIKSGDKELKAKDDYQIKLLTPIDGNSFSEGFEYYLRGTRVRSGHIAGDGSFAIDELPQDTYELRVAKPIKFQLVRLAKVDAPDHTDATDTTAGNNPGDHTSSGDADNHNSGDAGNGGAANGGTDHPHTLAAPTADQATDTAAPANKIFCATLYQDVNTDIRQGQRSATMFDDFHMYVTDDECTSQGSGTTLSL